MPDTDEKKHDAVVASDSDPTDADVTASDQGDVAEDSPDPSAEIERLTDKWKRALAEAENARKRADAAHAQGREHGLALAVEALAPAYDALSLGIESARADLHGDDPHIAAHLEGLSKSKTAFETGLKALGVRMIAPKQSAFDPELHEAMQMEETDAMAPGQVLVLHRPGFAIGARLIRPAHVTVSASPKVADG